MAKIKYLNKDVIDTTSGIISIIGKSFHKAMEVYYGGTDQAITSESEAIKYGLKAGIEYLDAFNDGFIEFSKTIPNKAKAFEILANAFNWYVVENKYVPNSVVSTEDKFEEKIEVNWKGKDLNLPVKLKGYIDLIERVDGKLDIVDYKTCYAYSDLDKIDGAKMLQAVIYYLLVYAKTGEEPYSFTFREIKYTKNTKPCIEKDCPRSHDSNGIHTQTQSYKIVFEENELFFDFFFRFYEDSIKYLNGEAVYLPNVYARFDNEVAIIAYIHRLDIPEETAKLMKLHKVERISDLLKKEIQSAGNMRKLMQVVESKFVTAKNIDYTNMKIEEKIQTKLLEHGMPLKFDSVIKGNTVDLYQYTPSFGLKMSKVQSYVSDIEQVLGKTGIRILTPIPNTSLVGIEVPKEERVFPVFKGKSNNLVVGLDTMGKEVELIVEEMPHLLVAGTTGSGKSVFLRQAIKQLKGKYNIQIIDPKGNEFDDGMSNHTEIATFFLSLTQIMNDRYAIMKKKKVRKWSETGEKSDIIIIDEYNDLYMSREKIIFGDEKDTAGNVIDTCVKKLAQKSRSAGIHLILATQRPSVKVLDGDIKSNFVSRISFQLPTITDSKVVLDINGAEKLLGKGDGLLLKNGFITRFQGFNI